MKLAFASVLLLVASPAFAEDDALRTAQSRAAQLAVTARMAAILCPGIEVDEDAIHGLMDHAQITDGDIMSPDRFGFEDEAIARSFKQSVNDDPTFCGKVAILLRSRLRLTR